MFCKGFCRLINSSCKLSSGYQPQGSDQPTTGLLPVMLHGGLSTLLGPLPLFHNLLTSSTTRLSPLEVCHGFQPLMFEHQESEVDLPSAPGLHHHPAGRRSLHPASASTPQLLHIVDRPMDPRLTMSGLWRPLPS